MISTLLLQSNYENNIWEICFKEKEYLKNPNSLNIFFEKKFIDSKVRFFKNNKIFCTIDTHNIILYKCYYFYNIINLKLNINENNHNNISIYDIYLDLPDNINEEIIQLFFILLYNEKLDNKFKLLLKSNLLFIHYLSNYFLNEELKLYCENKICKYLNVDNFVNIFYYCLIKNEFPYQIINGNERLFRFLIIWIKCFYNGFENFTLNNFINNLDKIIVNFNNYDIFINRSICNINSKYLDISFWTTLCFNCSDYNLFNTKCILLNIYNGFVINSNYLKEKFEFLLIKSNNNLYHLCIKRIFEFDKENNYSEFCIDDNEYNDYLKGSNIFTLSSSLNEEKEIKDKDSIYSKFQIETNLIKLKNTSNLNPLSYKTKPFYLKQNQIIEIARISIYDYDLINNEQCFRCQISEKIVLLGFHLHILKL